MTNIYPQPSKIEFLNKTFARPIAVSIKYTDFEKNVANHLINYFPQKLKITCCEGADYIIELKISDKEFSREGYSLTVEQKSTLIESGSNEGLFYGAQSLKQLFVQQKIACCLVTDEPRCAFRGFMVDVGRYFYSVKDLCTIIDWCALYKLNVLHLHLTEDQGWRVQIDKYPRLTEVGSKRTHTNFNCKKHEGYFSKADIRYIVEYAHKNCMIVIPEFEIPGHSRAAIAAYPELSCFDRILPVATHWGVKHDIMCAGKDFTYQFCYDVIDELIEMFPDGYIHIGGDEAPKTRWKLCPHCQKTIADNGIKNEDELQGFVSQKMIAYITSKGYKTISWFDASCGEVDEKNIIFQWWGCSEISESIKTSITKGAQYINSNSSAYYIDLPYGRISLADTYKTPIKFSNIEDVSAQHGLITTLWTEMIPNMKKAMRMTFPRMIAFAEKCWSDDSRQNYEVFISKLDEHKEFLKINGIKMPPKSVYSPTKFNAFFEKLWFERRKLMWEGLHNLIDNAKVEKMAKTKNTSGETKSK